MPAAQIQVLAERPDQPEVVALLEALDRYLGELYAPEHNHILDVQALCDPAVDFRVARLHGRAVGCGATRRMAAEPMTAGEPYGEVKRMVVAPEQRGRGVASALLAALEQGLMTAGLRDARLETGRDQHEALRLYRRHGYRPCAAFAGYPDNGLSVFLHKRLAP